MIRLSFFISLITVVLACGSKQPKGPQDIDLRGVWVSDTSRLGELFVVDSLPKGPEKTRAIERAEKDMASLKITFTADEVTMETPTSKRMIPYRVSRVYGPVIRLEGLNGVDKMSTNIRFENDQLTWFDAHGQIEFVLRRGP